MNNQMRTRLEYLRSMLALKDWGTPKDRKRAQAEILELKAIKEPNPEGISPEEDRERKSIMEEEHYK